MPATARLLYTVGHSTHPWDEFVAILRAHGVTQLADVRRHPGSRKYPHFNVTHLAAELPKAGIAYLPCPDLGGRRKPRPDSPNGAWRNESFRGYADYLLTEEFRDALARLERAARRRPTAIMCSEAVPWRCHRSLIADAMLARGWDARDIMSPTSAKPHKLPAWAHVDGTEVTYPASPDLFIAAAASRQRPG
jgi:uncharacterized protein (DUF488 family)